jgi:hypothetical protein
MVVVVAGSNPPLRDVELFGIPLTLLHVWLMKRDDGEHLLEETNEMKGGHSPLQIQQEEAL